MVRTIQTVKSSTLRALNPSKHGAPTNRRKKKQATRRTNVKKGVVATASVTSSADVVAKRRAKKAQRFIKRGSVNDAMIMRNMYNSTAKYENAVMDDINAHAKLILDKALVHAIFRGNRDYHESSDFLVRINEKDIEEVCDLLFGYKRIEIK